MEPAIIVAYGITIFIFCLLFALIEKDTDPKESSFTKMYLILVVFVLQALSMAYTNYLWWLVYRP